MSRHYLNVPYVDRAAAKELGCRWDPGLAKWYMVTTHKNLEVVRGKWPDKPELYLLGESLLPKPLVLRPQPPPEDTRGLRSIHDVMIPADWERLKVCVKARAEHLCEYCRAGGTMYVHDVYEYVPSRKYRKLVRLMAVCKKCREALAASGYPARAKFTNTAIGQIQMLRGLSVDAAIAEYKDAVSKVAPPEDMADQPWTTDLSVLSASGITLV